jgi:hypothetical protein
MPNTFIALDVPRGSAAGTPFIASATGHPKTFVLAGAVRPGARYVVEGSNDGGTTWDILVDDDGTEVFFTSRAAGAKSADCIVEQVRVRSIGGPPDQEPPSITMGAPPAGGPCFFGRLPVPASSGLGAPVDLGLATGPLKTFSLRGSVPPGSRYSVLASMDGVQFDEVLLFTADQQGARSREVMCRFLRVARAASGPTPVVTVGAEPLIEAGAAGDTPDISVGSEAKLATTTLGTDDVLAQYLVPLSLMAAPNLALTITALAQQEGATPDAVARLEVRLDGTTGLPDGDLIAEVPNVPASEAALLVPGPSFPRPAGPASLVKLIGRADVGRVTVRGFVLWFHKA